MNALNTSSSIWGKADDVLRDHYVRGKYRDVILPMTVIRRLDAVLEPSKDDVLHMKAQLDEVGITNQDRALRLASGALCGGRCYLLRRTLRQRVQLCTWAEVLQELIHAYLPTK